MLHVSSKRIASLQALSIILDIQQTIIDNLSATLNEYHFHQQLL